MVPRGSGRLSRASSKLDTTTDLHITSLNAGMKDMLNVMSKFLNLGMAG